MERRSLVLTGAPRSTSRGLPYFFIGVGSLPVAVLVSLPGVPAVPVALRAVLAIVGIEIAIERIDGKWKGAPSV